MTPPARRPRRPAPVRPLAAAGRERRQDGRRSPPSSPTPPARSPAPDAVLGRLGHALRRPAARWWTATPTTPRPRSRPPAPLSTAAAPPRSAPCTLAYLAHVEVSADHFDAAMLLAVDASLLAEGRSPTTPSRALRQAHHWLSLALTRLDLEELAVAQALRGLRVAAALPDLGDQWALLRLCAQQHAELAQTVHRRGDAARCRELADVAIRCATAARELPWEPARGRQRPAGRRPGLGDDAARRPGRRARPRCAGSAGTCSRGEAALWLVGYADLVLARLLGRLGAATPSRPAAGRGGRRAAGHRLRRVRRGRRPPPLPAVPAGAGPGHRRRWARPWRPCTGWRPTAPRPPPRTCGTARCGRRCSSGAAGCARPSGRPRCCAGTPWRTR